MVLLLETILDGRLFAVPLEESLQMVFITVVDLLRSEDVPYCPAASKKRGFFLVAIALISC